MRAWKSSYEVPPAPYRPGQKLRINGKNYKVIASTHSHTQLEGIKYAVSNWVIVQLKKGLSKKELSLPEDREFSSLRRFTDEEVSPTEYDLPKASNSTSTHATRRGKSPKGRHPTGGDLEFFLEIPQELRLKSMLVSNFLGKKKSLGKFGYRSY